MRRVAGRRSSVAVVVLFSLGVAFAQIRVPDAEQFVGPPRGAPISGALLDRRTDEVAALLRCPVCQGMSVADSPSTVAQDMKQEVREMLARGFSEEQILGYFEHSYGQFVLLRPKSLVVWLLPILALAIGIALVIAKLRKLEAPSSGDQRPATGDPYVDKVRQLVDNK